MEYLTLEDLERGEQSTFVFYSGSSNAIPGKGTNECAKRKFDKLDPDFRRQLSNFYPCDIVAEDGRKFPSAEHFFHAEKTALVDPKRARFFETGEEFGKLEPKKVVSKTGKNKKTGLNMGDKIKQWDEIKDTVLKQIWQLKFSQNDKLKKTLLSTGDARLVHYMKKMGKGALYQRWGGLEEIRLAMRDVTTSST